MKCVFSDVCHCLSGAKVCTFCRSRKMLQQEYLVAIVAVNTAEEDPLKIWADSISLFSYQSLCRK